MTYEMVILAVRCSCRTFLIKEGLGYAKAAMIWIWKLLEGYVFTLMPCHG